jgi:SAM-dependent methyltransferase
MKYSNIIGVSAPEIGWVPSPGFILRRAAILDVVEGFDQGTVLEIGCGPGGILYELGRKGFQCVGVELADISRSISDKLLAEFSTISIVSSLDAVDQVDFDYLFSFEVLEHIRDDLEALKNWVARLRKGGVVVISVPAHTKKWNVTDIMAGHFRRYDRHDIQDLVAAADLEIIELRTCGWPASWLLEKVRLLVKKRQLKKAGIDPAQIETGDVELSKKSGFDRHTEGRLFRYYGSTYFGQPLFFVATKIQKLFYKTGLGISYVVVARKTT